MGVKQWIKHALESVEDRKYKKDLESRRGSYEEWIARVEGTALDRSPLEQIEEYFAEHPETLILYGDEDVWEPGKSRECPWFRPDWSPEQMESCFYPGSLLTFRRAFLEEAMPRWRESLDQYLEGSGVIAALNETPDEAYREMMAGLFRKAGGWEKGCRTISHFHGILHHCSSRGRLMGFALQYRDLPGGKAPGSKEPSATGDAPVLLSVIIPSKDHPELLRNCLEALKRAAGKLPYEVIVVDNGSSPENRGKLQSLENISYLYRPMEFDFSKMCNLGSAAATGELLLFLNDDVELLPESDLERMEALARRPGVGSVGLKLYYPDSGKIQHAGITNLPMGPVHKLQFLEDDQDYYFGTNRGLRNVLAVSAACVMLRADRFREAGGFDESLRVAFNDVALGFRLYEMGYRNVCMCDAYAYHHESLTRGGDDSPQKLERLLGERERLYQLFPQLEGRDPYYSPFLGSRGLDTRIRPAYETMKNSCQEGKPLPVVLSGYREDPCLMGRIEEERGGEITGYALVLGDDNACYDFQLLLESGEKEGYGISLTAQYRPDLEENLPDQKHVGLCGFWVRPDLKELPQGRYRLGFAAKSRIGGTRLISRSNRYLEVGTRTDG